MNQVSIWHLLWKTIRYAFGLYLVDSFLWMFIMGLPAVPGLIIREFFNVLTDNSSNQFISSQSPSVWVALLLAIGVARIVVIFAGRITKTQHRFIVSSLLRRNLLAQLFQRPGAEPFIVDDLAVSPGELLTFFREDVNQVEDNVVGTNEIFGAGIFTIISLIILLSVNARFTMLVFLPLVAIALAIQYAEARVKRYRSASRQATQQVTGLIGEMFTAVQAIQVAGAETAMLNRLRLLSEQRRQCMVQDQVFTVVIGSSLENLVSLGTGLILLVAAQSFRSGDRTLNVGDFALFVYYLAFVTDFLSFLGGFLALTKQTEVAFERMGTLIEQSKAVEESNKDPAEKIIEYAPLYLPNLQGQVTKLPIIVQPSRDTFLQELNAIRLTYRYPGSNRGIDGINLTLPRGSLTVITGQVGSGKTTLLQVLLGLLPMQSGEIYWNAALVKYPDRFFIPPRSAYTPQVPQLFSNTLRENLLLGLQSREDELREAIAQAALDRDVAAMPEGLNTFIGSKGMRLSGGQLHRTAAARMLLRQPELLVFDDLSSALDLETEQKLWSCLFEIKRLSPLMRSLSHSSLHTYNPTCLAVSHRPFLLRQADLIIVLKDGRVEAEGKLEDLNLI
jgi:ABC-type multidrug transport system fused ATPase/permease subunit